MISGSYLYSFLRIYVILIEMDYDITNGNIYEMSKKHSLTEMYFLLKIDPGKCSLMSFKGKVNKMLMSYKKKGYNKRKVYLGTAFILPAKSSTPPSNNAVQCFESNEEVNKPCRQEKVWNSPKKFFLQSQLTNIRSLKNSLKRKFTCLEKENKTLTGSFDELKAKKTKLEKQVKNFRSTIAMMRKRKEQKVMKAKSQFNLELNEKEKEINDLLEEKSNLKNKCDELENHVAELEELDTNGESIVTYSPEVRTSLAYANVILNISFENISSDKNGLNFMLEMLTGTKLDNVPSPKTVRNFIFEVLIAHNILLAGKELTESNNLNQHWDGATDQKTNICAIAFEKPNLLEKTSEYIALAIPQMANETADEYKLRIENTIECAVRDYASYYNKDADDCLQQCKKNIKFSMSDRISTNSKTIRILQLGENDSFLELKCALHPIDTLESKTDKYFSDKEKTVVSLNYLNPLVYTKRGGSLLFATIRLVTSIRFKHGSGSPHAFQAFLSQQNTPDLLVRMHKRFYITFLNAGIICMQKDVILKFCNIHGKEKKICKIVSLLLRENTILNYLHGLGIFGKCVVGPWFRYIYCASTKMTDTDIFFQDLYSTCENLIQTPSLIFTPSFNAFTGADVIKDSRYTHLLDIGTSVPSDILLAISICAQACKDTLENQVKSHLSNHLSISANIADSQKKALECFDAHNMEPERMFARWRSTKNFKPNASPELASTIVVLRTSSVWEKLNSLKKDNYAEFLKLMNFCRKIGRDRQLVAKQNRKTIQAQQIEHMMEEAKTSAEKEDASLKVAEQKFIKVLDYHGKIWISNDDVEEGLIRIANEISKVNKNKKNFS